MGVTCKTETEQGLTSPSRWDGQCSVVDTLIVVGDTTVMEDITLMRVGESAVRLMSWHVIGSN